MEKLIFNLIEENQIIVISRHKNPDLDAYGAQFGLYYALKERFPKKEIYVIGDTNSLNSFKELDNISQETLSKSLFFILDTVSSQMLKDDSYASAKTVVLIDHHQNEPDISYDHYLRNVLASSTSEMVSKILSQNGISLTRDAARALFMGIVGDTGRFLYSGTTSETLRVAADLIDAGADFTDIFSKMYTETLQSKKVKSDFFNSIQLTKHKVAYHLNDNDFLNKHHLEPNYASRGLVNQMSGIDEVPVWVNLTEDLTNNVILVEIRSRNIPVVQVAKNHGGGGHLLACGCQVKEWKETEIILKELDQLVEENNG